MQSEDYGSPSKTYNHLIKEWLERNTPSKDQWAKEEEKHALISKKHHEHQKIVIEERRKFLQQMKDEKEQKEIQEKKRDNYPSMRSNLSNLYKPVQNSPDKNQQQAGADRNLERAYDFNKKSKSQVGSGSGSGGKAQTNFMRRRKEFQNVCDKPPDVPLRPRAIHNKNIITTQIANGNSRRVDNIEQSSSPTVQQEINMPVLSPLIINKQKSDPPKNTVFGVPRHIQRHQTESVDNKNNQLQHQNRQSNQSKLEPQDNFGGSIRKQDRNQSHRNKDINFYNGNMLSRDQNIIMQNQNESNTDDSQNESDDEYDQKWPKKIVKQVIYLDKDDCAICMQPLAENGIRRRLRCNHAFHSRCIDKWFFTSKNCPTCRQRARQ